MRDGEGILLIFREIEKKSSVFQEWEKRHWRLGKKILSSQPGQIERQTFQETEFKIFW